MSGISYELIDKRISFTTVAPTILGASIKNAKLLSILDYTTASTMADIIQKHINLYPYLPQGTPNDYRKYKYLHLELLSGEVAVFGIPWIDEQSIVVNQDITYVVTIPSQSVSDLTIIRNALISNGIDNFTVDVKAP